MNLKELNPINKKVLETYCLKAAKIHCNLWQKQQKTLELVRKFFFYIAILKQTYLNFFNHFFSLFFFNIEIILKQKYLNFFFDFFFLFFFFSILK